jgi:biopolymer transport protein ExbB
MRVIGRLQIWRGVLSLAMVAMLCAVVVRANQESSEAKADVAEPAAAEKAAAPVDTSIRLWDLAVAGGVFMIPIAAMSVLAVTMTLERLFALRRQRVLPAGLARGMEQLSNKPDFDTREARRLCERFPSAAANVVRAMLARAGRPAGEIESAVGQASQREADRLYANVRWINLAASLSTMLGLIGTIQGMIMAFHRLTVTDVVADRTTMLAGGIYTALVTTFAGLAVAIPALLMSHLLEGKILAAFHQIDELTFQLLPAVAEGQGGGDGGSEPMRNTVVENELRLRTFPGRGSGREP